MLRHWLRRFRYTSFALALALMVVMAAVVWNIDVFELPGVNIVGIEQNEVGEIVISFLFVIPAFFVDRRVIMRHRAHQAQLQAEQLRVLRVTMRTVHDIVNNNLNQLQLLRFEADGHVPEDTLRVFDDALRNTAAQLTALSNMEAFAEAPMASGPGLDVDGPPGSP